MAGRGIPGMADLQRFFAITNAAVSALDSAPVPTGSLVLRAL